MSYPQFNKTITYLGAGPDGEVVDLRYLNGSDSKYVHDDERKIYEKLRAAIPVHAKNNEKKLDYYNARQVIEHLEIAVPAHLSNIGVAVGWAGTTVDAIDERIDFLGWATESGQLKGLDEVFVDNNLAVESNFAHLDSLNTGVGFVTVGTGLDDPEQVNVTIESSSAASLIWDHARRRSFAGLSQTFDDDGNVIMETLYLQDANIIFDVDATTGQMEVRKRDQHDLRRCLMTRLPNRVHPHQREGRSEITKAVRYYTDAAVRTMLGMEVNREFYTAPQRFILNAKPSDFGVTKDMTAEQKYMRGLSVAMGMINIVPGREDNSEGDPLSVHEMKPAPPTPYIEQVKAYSIQMSAETGLPATLFGFVTDNPTSGDAIVKSEFRLTRKSARRISSFGLGWKEVALLAQLVKNGSAKVDSDFQRQLRCKFANPMLPTPSATADEIQKMIAAEVLVPDSSVTYDLYGRLDDQQIKILTRDKVKYEAKKAREAMQEQARAAATAAASGGGSPAPGGNPTATKKPAAK